MTPSRSLARGLLAFVLAAVAAGGATAALIPSHGELRAVAQKAADAVARGDAGALWELQSAGARFAIDKGYRAAVEANMRELVSKSKAGEPIQAPDPKSPGAPGRTARDAWADDLESRIGGPERRKAFAGARIASVEVDRERGIARVRMTLATGQVQAFRAVHTETGWLLDGFAPFSAD